MADYPHSAMTEAAEPLMATGANARAICDAMRQRMNEQEAHIAQLQTELDQTNRVLAEFQLPPPIWQGH